MIKCCLNEGRKIYTRQEIISLLRDNSQNERIYTLADKIREEKVGNEIHLRALIEFSNICKRQCRYCGLQSCNRNINRYRISISEIIEYVQRAVDLGFKTIVLQSGEDDYFDIDKICEIISAIKQYNVALTLSIGEKSYEEYKAYKEAGADRYLIRIETTDKGLYKQMHPNMDFENRVRCLENLKALGYEVGTGCIVGLPNQTIESLADDILFFKSIDADMVGIGPFIPHPDTELKAASAGNFDLALKVMALTRIELKNINIPATTAMETIVQNGRIKALKSGANVVMPNIVDDFYKNKYEIYPNKNNADTNLEELKRNFEAIGRNVSNDYGFRNA